MGPHYKVLDRAVQFLTDGPWEELPAPTLETTLSEVFERAGLLGASERETAELLNAFPPVLKDAALTVAVSALRRGSQVSVVWMPGYEFELTVSQATKGGRGEVAVLVRSPYPDEVLAARRGAPVKPTKARTAVKAARPRPGVKARPAAKVRQAGKSTKAGTASARTR
jgi:hypothetical protein